MPDSRIQVLVVDDSVVAQMHLSRILESDPKIEVIGAVPNGKVALDFIKTQAPDLILMDIDMPVLDGFETTRRIMETQPVPIIICTAATNTTDRAMTFRVMEAGAVACVEKPCGREHPEFETQANDLRQTVVTMSEVKVVRRWSKLKMASPFRAQAVKPVEQKRSASDLRIIGIGTSTGGPPVLQTILSELPCDLAVPILIVQHIAGGFLSGMAGWLEETSSLQIHIAVQGELPLPGHVYLAPDNFHMGVSTNGTIMLAREEPLNGVRPAVSFLFRSLAEVCGSHAVGVLLTGMGRDGAEELKLMRDNGAVTIAQDRESSVVHGMPGEAIRLGAAMHVLPADKIANFLIRLVNRKMKSEVGA